MSSPRVAAAAVFTTFVLLAASCGSTDTDNSAVLRSAEQVQINPDNMAQTTTVAPSSSAVDAPSTEGESASGAIGQSTTTEDVRAATSTTTIPLNEGDADPISGLFKALKIFNGCLGDKGTAFIGLPILGGDPLDPVNDSQYISDLIDCAAVSQIQAALEDLETAGNNIPADQIEDRNRGLIEWAECMKGRGWQFSDLAPDSRGLLQIPQDLTPPAGETILDSDDMQECRDIAVARIEAATP